MSRKPRYTDDQLKKALAESQSIFEILPKLGLSKSGGNHRLIKLRIAKLGLDTSHILGRGYLRGKSHSWAPKRPLNEILIRNSTYTNSTHLKERLLKEGLLENKCQICGQPPVWNGKLLILILDHENGNREDQRLENLRIICRHCDSQLETFSGRNSTKKPNPDETISLWKELGTSKMAEKFGVQPRTVSYWLTQARKVIR